MSKFKPLRHGEKFVMHGLGVPPQKFICRTGPLDPEKALGQGWCYTNACTEKDEGITWARGWHTKAANALRVAYALGRTDRDLPPGWSSHTYAIQLGEGPTEPPVA